MQLFTNFQSPNTLLEIRLATLLKRHKYCKNCQNNIKKHFHYFVYYLFKGPFKQCFFAENMNYSKQDFLYVILQLKKVVLLSATVIKRIFPKKLFIVLFFTFFISDFCSLFQWLSTLCTATPSPRPRTSRSPVATPGSATGSSPSTTDSRSSSGPSPRQLPSRRSPRCPSSAMPSTTSRPCRCCWTRTPSPPRTMTQPPHITSHPAVAIPPLFPLTNTLITSPTLILNTLGWVCHRPTRPLSPQSHPILATTRPSSPATPAPSLATGPLEKKNSISCHPI